MNPAPPMLLLAVLLLLGGALAADEVQPCPLRTKVFRVPPGYIGDAGSGPIGTPAEPPVARRLEAAEYLKAAGIEIPPGGEATFEPSRSRLVIRATNDVIEKVRVLVEASLNLEPREVQVVLGVAEFEVPHANSLQDLSYERARALAGDSWRLLERSSLLAKSGQKSTGHFPITSSAPEASAVKTKRTPANATPEWRSEKLEIEPQIGPDGTSVELQFAVVRKQPAGLPPKHVDVIEKVALQNDSPILVRAVALPAAKGAQLTTVRALIVRATVVDVRGERPAPPVPEPPPEHHQ